MMPKPSARAIGGRAWHPGPPGYQTGGRTGPANGAAVPVLPTLQACGQAWGLGGTQGGLPGPRLPCGGQPPQGLQDPVGLTLWISRARPKQGEAMSGPKVFSSPGRLAWPRGSADKNPASEISGERGDPLLNMILTQLSFVLSSWG